ncbi:U4/U6 small nuclear ribonucleoprotein PRP31 [Strigomonas culicis]|uniref:U4/U6 small nuclear ribonucleoprotein PRP31 n=1 Tax=Strigomonas culicis TaxID=28005 RepID=S9UWB2_9TRYP|nr:U4/U6 small nuclear ribonucleoprotein PRP31 [Strigomonas culicis]EPY33158.1 U4/U6 small nuclear ribonucleoprotein PRP31 [Strigomonas culicis]EPY34355.1 U4/U6 small nuclear ribonucleoprotein PRP31 [Strigomonas culicis]|eukprot:EPY29152.1 U4/U6 small nuclear ribonucleoprotein PRP31 [Strigomonas culicis]
MAEEGFDNIVVKDTAIAAYEDNDVSLLSDEDALKYNSVTEVTKLLRSAYLSSMFLKLKDYENSKKNAITPDDPEYLYVTECSAFVLRIEAEKSRVMVFLRAHFSVCFPELAMFFSDSVLYAKVAKLIVTGDSLSSIVPQLNELLPSQLLVVVIACASTTTGRTLSESEKSVVLEACQEMENLELTKQIFLEDIQLYMPRVCPNLCAFLGTGITSQLFALVGSVAKIAILDSADLLLLGSKRSASSGINIKTVGFLSNADLVANLQPQLRPKALRLVAASVLKLARIDSNRRASSDEDGVRERRFVCNRIKQWLDPPVVRGGGHNMYERRGRKRARRQF